MPNIVYVVRLHLEREGANASALFVSPVEEDMRDLIKRAASMGIVAHVDVDPAPLSTKAQIVEWLDQYNTSATPEPSIERPEYEQRLDELTRSLRSTDRKLDRLADILGDVVEQMTARNGVEPSPAIRVATRPPGAIPDDAVPPANIEPGPRITSAPSLERGEQDMADVARTLKGQAKGTGGMLPGNMELAGGNASSEAWGIGTDPQTGEPTTVRTSLPKVGDTLKPPHLRNGG